MGETKEKLRAIARLRRDALSIADAADKSRLIQERVLQFSPYMFSRAVALYSSMQNEVATAGIRDHALKEGKRVFYPRVAGDTGGDFAELKRAGDLRPGRYGILEPAGNVLLTQRDEEGLVVFVPALAFDLRGNRLGRGKGWYDRALSRLGAGVTLAGLAYELQIFDRLPAERWDCKVDHIITESRVVDCGDRPSSDSGWVS
jgi:5-formyltetrahydrofolate cyclo-ligase